MTRSGQGERCIRSHGFVRAIQCIEQGALVHRMLADRLQKIARSLLNRAAGRMFEPGLDHVRLRALREVVIETPARQIKRDYI
jgi:hypothetical protein